MSSIPEADELSADIHRLFRELESALGHASQPGGPVHSPPLDIVETSSTLDVLVDLPGVDARHVRVLFKRGALIILGEKLAPDAVGRDGSAFHLIERSFGRFARIVHFDTAIDPGRARAWLVAGVLRVSVPRIVERRGREIVVRIDTTPA